MRLPDFKFEKPASLNEVLAMFDPSSGNACLLAGGTDLLINMRLGIVEPETVISIRSLPELNSVSEESDGSISIGAGCTLSELAKNLLITERLPSLSDAIKSVASKHLRNIATIGGNLCLDNRCWYYNQSKSWRSARESCHKTGGKMCHSIKNSKECHAINRSDIAPVLLAINAELIIKKTGHERRIPVEEFFVKSGLKGNALEPGEILTSIIIPDDLSKKETVFIKAANRKGIDFGLGNIAVSLTKEGNDITEAAIYIGAFTSAPVKLEKTASIVMKSGLNDKSIEAASEIARKEAGTLTNLFNSAGYKRDLIRGLVKKALTNLEKRAM